MPPCFVGELLADTIWPATFRSNVQRWFSMSQASSSALLLIGKTWARLPSLPKFSRHRLFWEAFSLSGLIDDCDFNALRFKAIDLS